MQLPRVTRTCCNYTGLSRKQETRPCLFAVSFRMFPACEHYVHPDYLLRCDAVCSSTNTEPMFRRNVLTPSTWSTPKSSKQYVFTLVAACFDPEDVGGMFLRNIGILLPHYTASHPRRQYSPQLPPWEPQISLTTSLQCLIITEFYD
jgi:hypothetical protein